RTLAPADRSSRSLLSAAALPPIRATVPDERSRKTGKKRIWQISSLKRMMFYIVIKTGHQIAKYSTTDQFGRDTDQLANSRKRAGSFPGQSRWPRPRTVDPRQVRRAKSGVAVTPAAEAE